MQNDEHINILEIMYRIQARFNDILSKHYCINVSFGNKIIHQFPVNHIFLFSQQLSEPILKQINNINTIHFDFNNQNDFIFDYFSKGFYKDVLKYKEETNQIWNIFNKGKVYENNKKISKIESCIEQMKEKWEKGINDYRKEIIFIEDNIEEFIKNEEEEFIKGIPFEIHSIILQELSDNIKNQWISNIISEGKENILKWRRIENIKELNIEKIKELKLEEVIEIIKKEGNMNATKKKMKEVLLQNIYKEEEKIIKIKNIANEGKFKSETNMKDTKQQVEEIQEKTKEKIDDEENREILKKEGKKQLAQLENGLSKEQQLLKASEKGYLYGIKKLLIERVNINSKDKKNHKRRRYKDLHH